MTVAEFINKVGFKVDQSSVTKVNNTISDIKSRAAKMLSAIGVGISLTAINALVEEFGAANQQIQSAVGGLKNMTNVQDLVLEKANEARLAYTDMAGYVSNLVKAGPDIFPVDDAMQFASTVAKLMKTNGRNDSAIASMMEGFNKSFQKGIVDSETLNKTLEQAPEPANILAGSLGVAKSQLLTMASEGTMTVQQLKAAFMDSSGAIDAAFSQMDMSVTDALKNVRNKWGLWLAEMDSSLGVTNFISRGIVKLTDIALRGLNRVRTATVWLNEKLGGSNNLLKLVTAAAGAFAAVTAAQSFGQFATFLKDINTKLGLINTKSMKTAAVLIVLALLVEDFVSFLQGNDSLIGSAFDSLGIGADQARDAIKNAFGKVKEIITTVWPSITGFLSDHSESIKNMFSEIWGMVGRILFKVFSSIASAATSIFSALQAFWARWGDKITAVIASLAGFFGRTFERIIAVITQFADFLSAVFDGDIQGALQSLRVIFETILNQIADLVKTVFTAIWTAISDRVTKIKDSIVDGFTAAIDWIKALPAQAIQWGADIIQGIVDGIKGAVGKVGEAASSVAGKIKSFLHFSKPDEGPLRDFDTYMPDMIDTMVKGISAGRSKVNEVIGNIASDIAGGMPDVHAEVMTTTAKGSTAGLQQIGASKDKLLDAVQALIGGIAVMAQYNAAVSPATAATVYGGNTSRTIIQNNNFHQQFNGDQAIQRKTAAATAKVSEDATAALARSLAYLK